MATEENRMGEKKVKRWMAPHPGITRDLKEVVFARDFDALQKKYEERVSKVRTLEMNISHLELYGNCPHCEPIYGCCQTASGCGCYGYPTDFIATEKCLDRCSSRLVQQLNSKDQEIARLRAVLSEIGNTCPTLVGAMRIAKEALGEELPDDLKV